VDAAHLLPADLAASLSAELAAHEARTGNQVVLLTLPSLEGEPLEEFSHRVATAWQLGRKGTDNGVLMLVVPGERKIRIEVGYGLEGTLTDAKSSRIIRDEMAPRFRAGDFPGGIAAGVKAVLGTIEGTYRPPERAPVQTGRAQSALGMLFIAVVVGILTAAIAGHRLKGGSLGSVMAFVLTLSSGFLLAIVAAVIVLIVALALGSATGSGRRSYGGFGGWGGGSFGGFSGGGGFGGGFSGGGGSFGGGGASGSW